MKEHNPMQRPDVRAKVSAAHHGKGWLAKVRGGNGAPMPTPQLLLHLITGWPTEYSISTGNPKWRAAVVDLACPDLKIAIECDGQSHRTKAQRNRDRIKEQMLTEQGWLVLRFTNKQILEETETIIQEITEASQQRSSQFIP